MPTHSPCRTPKSAPAQRPRVLPADDRRRRAAAAAGCAARLAARRGGDGRVVFAGTATEEFYNGMGVAHGGWAATLLDSALGCAINTHDAGRPRVHDARTQDQLHAAAAPRSRARCAAKRDVIHVGSRTATSEGAHRRRQRQALRARHDDVHRWCEHRHGCGTSSRHAECRAECRNSCTYGVSDRVAVLTIDNPPVNALGAGVWEAIDEAVARARSTMPSRRHRPDRRRRRRSSPAPTSTSSRR